MKQAVMRLCVALIGAGLMSGLMSGVVSGVVSGPALAQPAGDPAAGKKIFNKCKSCHALEPGAKKATGPNLHGVFGRMAGTDSYKKYGKSMIAAGKAGLIWDEAAIFDYIADPKEFLARYLDLPKNKVKNKMTIKLKDEQQRADVIAYIKQVTQ